MSLDGNLQVLIGLLNTRHVPDDDDVLADADRADVWATGQLDRPASLDEVGRRRLRDLREGLRSSLRHRQAVDNHVAAASDADNSVVDPGPGAAELAESWARADAVLRAAPLVLTAPTSAGASQLRAAAEVPTSGEDLIALVAAAVLNAQNTGAWSRLKTCADPGCQWAFGDTSKNGTRRWHSMASCGNRAKNRVYRSRSQAPTIRTGPAKKNPDLR